MPASGRKRDADQVAGVKAARLISDSTSDFAKGGRSCSPASSSTAPSWPGSSPSSSSCSAAIAAVLLPIAEYPEITPPTVQVTARYPGANAQVVADTVAAPIEQQVIGVEDMLYMSSQSNNDGSYTLDVTFELGTDVNMAQVLVQNRVAIAEPTLPDVVRTIGVTVKKRSPDILLVVSLYSEDNPATGRALLRPALPEQLRHHPAQGRAGPGGGRRRRGDLRPAGLQHARLAGPGQAAVAEPDGRRRDPGACASRTCRWRPGRSASRPSRKGQDFQYTLSTLGRLVEAEQFADIILKTGADGEVTYLKDVARIELGARSQDTLSRRDGKPSAGPRHLSAARLERPGRRRRRQGQDAGAGNALPQGTATTPSTTTPRRSSASR